MVELVLAGALLFGTFVGLNLLVLSSERETYRDYVGRKLPRRSRRMGPPQQA